MIARLTLVAGLAGAVLAGPVLAAPAYAAAPTWTATIAPIAQARTAAGLRDIACPSARLCIGIPAGQPAVVEIRNGLPTARALPLPIDAADPSDAALSAIACSSPKWCVAVGSYRTYTDRRRPLFETFRNGIWRATAASGPAEALQSVACNRRTCLATGSWYAGYYDDTALYERDTAGRWTQQSVDIAYGDSAADPACTPGDGPCFAQVYHQYYAYPYNRQFLYPSGTGWRKVSFPGPAGADLTSLQLGAMSCPRVDYCVAVGSYLDLAAPHAQHLVAEKWGSGRLSATEIALPTVLTDQQDVLFPTDTACVSRAHCVASATFYDYRHHHDAVVLSKAGSVWTAQRAPVPDGRQASRAWLEDVSCSATGFCAAVGSVGGDAGREPLAEDWSGGSWSPTAVPLPAGHTTGTLRGVACRGAGCVAAGATQGDPLLAFRT